MNSRIFLSFGLSTLCSFLVSPMVAAENGVAYADMHAPISVMGDHYHRAGEWMVSYRYMRMDMEGNRIGTDEVSPEDIATTVPNRFANPPMSPPTLRVVPTRMTMDMHMVGAMYAPTDWLTLMAMFNYVEKEMDHVTFQGPMGSTRLGTFTTRSEGIGDTPLTALIRLRQTSSSRLHATLGVSAPTGSTDEQDTVLTPMNTMPTLRLPYPMQLGSGTWDPILGLTYFMKYTDRIGLGIQWRSTFRVGDNDEDYSLGNEHKGTAWASYLFTPAVSGSIRIEGYDRGNIDGQDPRITAPVQTADPDNQGISRIDLGFGLNLAGQNDLKGHRVAFEFLLPVHQDLDGPQLETDWMLTAGYQFAF